MVDRTGRDIDFDAQGSGIYRMRTVWFEGGYMPIRRTLEKCGYSQVSCVSDETTLEAIFQKKYVGESSVSAKFSTSKPIIENVWISRIDLADKDPEFEKAFNETTKHVGWFELFGDQK